MVFAGLYPVEGSEYPQLRDALEKLRLNDASFFCEPETSAALGFGFRCGFLGLLHMEIVQERLEREFDMDLITTAPGVLVPRDDDRRRGAGDRQPVEAAGHRAHREDRGAGHHRDDADAVRARRRDPAALPGEARRPEVDRVPRVADRVLITYELPFNEVVLDFYDRLKTISRGYASLDYHVTGYQESPLVKLDILVNEEPVDALSVIVHRDTAYARGRALASKMRELIPRQMFEVAIQAAIGSRIIARESVKALRKNVLAKCYGGDISRKRKLLEKQKEGKKRMKRVGRVEIPQEAFLAVLKVGTESMSAHVHANPSLREYFESIVIAVILALFVRTWVVQAFKIPTGSMENNLLIGDHLLVNKFVFGPTPLALERALLPVRDIRRGDIVVFKYPDEPDRDFIKRVIGLPGETVELRNKKVYINGQPLDEPYVHFLEPPSDSQEVTSFDVRERYGPVQRARRALLRDGRQSRQLAGQPLLGVPAARTTSRARR